eukprot:gene400-48204_t
MRDGKPARPQHALCVAASSEVRCGDAAERTNACAGAAADGAAALRRRAAALQLARPLRALICHLHDLRAADVIRPRAGAGAAGPAMLCFELLPRGGTEGAGEW